MNKIEELRRWIEVCEKSGIEIPEQIHQFDAYARLLEAGIAQLRSELATMTTVRDDIYVLLTEKRNIIGKMKDELANLAALRAQVGGKKKA